MGNSNRHPAELRERAVRMVHEWRQARGKRDGGAVDVAAKLGVHPDSVRGRVRRHDADSGRGPGLTTAERARLAEMERENRELRRANEILKAASAFFAREPGPRPPRRAPSSTRTGTGAPRACAGGSSRPARRPRPPRPATARPGAARRAPAAGATRSSGPRSCA
jgi:transposase